MINHLKQLKNQFFCCFVLREPRERAQAGFTLIELLVVISIMFVLLGVSFVGYRQKGKELELQRAASKVVADIERAREMAMSAYKFGPSGEVPKGGYGIYFNTSKPSQYILFADLDSNRLRRVDGGEDVQVILLKEGIVLKTLVPATPITVTFSPPSPDVYLQGGAVFNEVNIIIALSDNLSKTKTIIINGAGLASVTD